MTYLVELRLLLTSMQLEALTRLLKQVEMGEVPIKSLDREALLDIKTALDKLENEG